MAILDPVLNPLLGIPPFWLIMLISFVLAVIITFAYKLMTDQELMKTLKADMKGFQKKMQEFKHDPAKMMEMQKEAMEKNMKYMMHSMRPTLVTFLPIILIFGWLSGHFVYEPIMPYEEFEVTLEFIEGVNSSVGITLSPSLLVIGKAVQTPVNGKVVYTLQGEPGDYTLEFTVGDTTYTKDVLITESQIYAPVVKSVNDGVLKSISLSNEQLILVNVFGIDLSKMGNDLGFFGNLLWFFKGVWGWLGTYIVFSIVFSMTLRKLLKVH